jgi:hypothetical protein
MHSSNPNLGGHLKPDVYLGISNYMKQHGPELAAEVARFERSHVSAEKEIVEREGIDCDFVLTRTLDVFLDEGQAGEMKEAYERLVKMGWDFVSDVQFTGVRDAEMVGLMDLFLLLVSSCLQDDRFQELKGRKRVRVTRRRTFGRTSSLCIS